MSLSFHHVWSARLSSLAAAFIFCLLPAASSAQTQPEPRRIVTLGGSLTEIVFALGAGEDVVAADASSTYPGTVRSLPQLGYFRAVSAEGVLSMNPSLVLARDDSGPATALDQIRSVGIPVVIIPSESSLEGSREKIRLVAEAVGREDAGERLIASLDEDLSQIPARGSSGGSNGSDAPSVLFIYARGGGTLNVSGTGTAADAMIELAGGENAIPGYEGYRPLTAESVVSAAPDVILMLDRGLESVGGVDGLLELPGIALTPAGRSRRIVSMDDGLFLSFGPRLGEAVKLLHAHLNPASN